MALGKLALAWVAVEIGVALLLLSKAGAGGSGRWKFRAVITPGTGYDLGSLQTSLFQSIPGVSIEQVNNTAERTIVVFTRPVDKPPTQPSKLAVGSYSILITPEGPA